MLFPLACVREGERGPDCPVPISPSVRRQVSVRFETVRHSPSVNVQESLRRGSTAIGVWVFGGKGSVTTFGGSCVPIPTRRGRSMA